jgi:hypothetical protein
LRVTTRQRVAILDRIFANPLLAPRRNEHSSGVYALSQIEANRVTLVPRDSTLGLIELVTTNSRAEGRRRFLSGMLDIGWGIGVPPEFWANDDPGPFPATRELDMFVIATAGRDVPQVTADRILESLRLDHDAPAGVEPTVSRFSATPHVPGEKAETLGAPAGHWPLYFTDFPPNRELADYLARASEGRLLPTTLDYKTMIAGLVPKTGFSLQIHATHFPDTLGLQIESLLVARGSIPAAAELRAITLSGWEAESDEHRLESARAAESPLDQMLRRRVIGRVRPRFRSRTPIELPRSGWFDFKQLAKEKAA